MIDENIQKNSLNAWVRAARPKTLTGAVLPVMIGTALALKSTDYQIKIFPTMLCFIFAFFMQIDANFVNDYFDFIRGTDNESRLGPKRACAEGWVTIAAMKKAIILTTFISCLIGLPLVAYGGWIMIVIGILCVLFCFLYTTCFSYLGLGDVLVLIFFGVVPLSITYALAAGISLMSISYKVLIVSLSCGFVIDTLLIVNNYRDIESDKKVGKNTLIVKMGKKKGGKFYFASGLIPCLLNLVLVKECSIWAFLLPLIYLTLHTMTYKQMLHVKGGQQMNMILSKTARNMFFYGILLSIGILVG